MPVIERGVGLDRTVYKLPVSLFIHISLFIFSLFQSTNQLFFSYIYYLLLSSYFHQVVVVDDFADLTPEIIHLAYVEAVYREDEWEYERLTLPFWKNMIKQASESQSSDIFYHHFPLKSGNS